MVLADTFLPISSSIFAAMFYLRRQISSSLGVEKAKLKNGLTEVSNELAQLLSYSEDYVSTSQLESIIEQLESFNFKYNPGLANEIITRALEERGAKKNNDKWQINEKPITITIFIRSDDPVRKSIGEILAVELERIGFTVKKDFGDLNKAYVVVYGSNPSDLKWRPIDTPRRP